MVAVNWYYLKRHSLIMLGRIMLLTYLSLGQFGMYNLEVPRIKFLYKYIEYRSVLNFAR